MHPFCLKTCSIDAAAGPTPLSVHESDCSSAQMAHWLRERLQQGCFVLLNFNNIHFAALLQPDEGNQVPLPSHSSQQPVPVPCSVLLLLSFSWCCRFNGRECCSLPRRNLTDAAQGMILRSSRQLGPPSGRNPPPPAPSRRNA